MKERDTKYHCGQLLLDRDGVVSHGQRVTYLLLSRDGEQYGDKVLMAWKAAKLRGGGAPVVDLFEEDLDKLEVVGWLRHDPPAILPPEDTSMIYNP